MGAGDIFSPACHPSQTAHQVLSPFGLAVQIRVGSVTWSAPLFLAEKLRSLLPTLYAPTRTATPGCSKVPGVFPTHWESSAYAPSSGFTGSAAGTAGVSLRRSQSRQLIGKALRLLKKVTVTSAVYQPLVRLNPDFRYWHWAGVAGCTNPFGLAASYVFVKQSDPPSHCTLRKQPQGPPSQGPHLPKLRGQFAEFPCLRLSPSHLSLLSQGTCNGSRYGHPGSFLSAFSGAPGIGRTPHTRGPSQCCSGSRHYDSPRTCTG